MANPFDISCVKKNKVPDVIFPNADDDTIDEFQEIEHLKKLGDKDTDFIIEKVVEKISSVNRRDYINSFRDDVGILNIIKKVKLTGDVSLLNQRQTIQGTPGEVIDFTNVPTDNIEAGDLLDNTYALFKSIPEELRGKLSIEDFLRNVSKDDLINFYKSKLNIKDNEEENKNA